LINTYAKGFAADYPAYIPQGLKALPQGELFRNIDSMAGINVSGSGNSYKLVDVSGLPFSKGLRIEVNEIADEGYHVAIRIPTPRAISKGDVLLMVFWLRQEDPGEDGFITSLLEQCVTWTKSLFQSFVPQSEWRQYVFAFDALVDQAGGEGLYGFNLGYSKQTVIIGGFDCIYFGRQVALDDLIPFETKLSYVGREPGAAWRREAENRIKQIRMSDVRLKVVQDGLPVTGANVTFSMQRHHFLFGTAVNAGLITPQSENEYMSKIKLLFNNAVIENHLKWRSWNPTVSQTAIDWLHKQNISVRGHCLVWPSWRYMPDWVSKDNAQLLEQQIRERIQTAVTTFKGQLIDWDVVNELYSNHEAVDLIGEHVVADWFAEAKKCDPQTGMYINDYDILEGEEAKHRDAYYQTIEDLLKQKVSVEGIGLQSHFLGGGSCTAPVKVLERLDRFAGLGLSVKITEFDIDTRDEDFQADYTRDFMTATFSHPAVRAFIMWGFWEGNHWRPRGAMFKTDWTKKKNYYQYYDLVFSKWWSNETSKTNATGDASALVFKGDYQIMVKIGGETKIASCSITSDTSLTFDWNSGNITNLVAGWNWVSFNVLPVDQSFASVFSGILSQIEQVKTQTASTIYGSNTWSGDLKNMSGIGKGLMYKVKIKAACYLNVTGTVTLSATPIFLQAGWNWVAFLPTTAIPIATALASINGHVQEVKSLTQQATYSGGVWSGALTQMEPGQGYAIKMSAPGTLTYPAGQ
jgi:GH35 family endo-1,4-beta-xylanase